MGVMTDAPALSSQRGRIDAIDAALVALLAQRVAVVREVIAIKNREGLAARLPARVEAVVAHVRDVATKTDCPPDLAETVWRSMIEWTIAFEERSLLPVAE